MPYVLVKMVFDLSLGGHGPPDIACKFEGGSHYTRVQLSSCLGPQSSSSSKCLKSSSYMPKSVPNPGLSLDISPTVSHQHSVVQPQHPNLAKLSLPCEDYYIRFTDIYLQPRFYTPPLHSLQGTCTTSNSL